MLPSIKYHPLDACQRRAHTHKKHRVHLLFFAEARIFMRFISDKFSYFSIWFGLFLVKLWAISNNAHISVIVTIVTGDLRALASLRPWDKPWVANFDPSVAISIFLYINFFSLKLARVNTTTFNTGPSTRVPSLRSCSRCYYRERMYFYFDLNQEVVIRIYYSGWTVIKYGLRCPLKS